ncbi:MAG: four helix bundle protein [Acidobacteriota bacterium]|nr:four helix bundle protein [Acidobacteriota bacterium]
MEPDIYDRVFEFASRIVRLHCELTRRRGSHTVLINQLLRCGTSVGSNLEEAKAAQSKADFIARSRIALKEARESHYWLRLIAASGFVTSTRMEPLVGEANEIVAVLTSIVLNTTRNAQHS